MKNITHELEIKGDNSLHKIHFAMNSNWPLRLPFGCQLWRSRDGRHHHSSAQGSSPIVEAAATVAAVSSAAALEVKAVMGKMDEFANGRKELL